MSKKPTVLMILDGYGLNDKCEHNAVCEAKTPIMDQLMSQCPYVKGQASGLAVGLPDGQMGNSEVGHLNMGAGRVVYQELTRITKAIQDGDFFENEELVKAVENAKANNSALHLFGLLSDGGVHSHITHVFGLLELAKRKGLEKVYVHCFLDGRDTPPASGKSYVEQLQAKMDEIGVGEIGVISGRYYAMDRDNRWDRVELAYKALTKGEGVEGTDAAEAVQASYDAEKTDEFVLPTVLKKDGKPVATIQDKDSVIFFNFRPDRARELTRAFCADEFTGFVTDCISIRHANRHHLQAFCFRVVALLGFHAVSCFFRYGFCHDVLELEVFVQHRHSGFQRPILPIEAGGDDGNQHIGVVPNFVCIHLHFIIFRMMAGVIAHFLFELPFHAGIRAFRRFYVCFLRRISANHDGFQHRLRQRRTGLHFFAFSWRGSSSSPCPTSPATQTTSQS